MYLYFTFFAEVKYFFKILFKLSYVPCYGRNVTKLNFLQFL